MSSTRIKHYLKRRSEFNALNNRLEAAKSRIQKKKHLLNKSQKNDRFLEVEARRNLGLIHPEEVEFRFIEWKNDGNILSDKNSEKQ